MLTGAQMKEHVLNRLGYGMSPWHVDRYDALGADAYIAEQLGGGLPAITDLGTTIGDKLTRDVVSYRQLEATLLDFWFNHFNVDTLSTDPEKVARTISGRGVGHHQNVAILPHVLGDFGAMLLDTARSPSMLDYLDNRINYEEEVVNGKVYGRNDNYAREVMELHTIGVDGGYTEGDIIEVSRILTGWSVSNDQYAFKTSRHDFGDKTVMGVYYPPARGEEEGVELLDRLANHPSAARFLAGKIAARFVAEDPPAGVHVAAESAYGPNRDLAAVMTTVFAHPDFVDPSSFRAKVKPPHRYAASALQAMGATDVSQWAEISTQLITGIIDAGETPYVVGPPTGYPETSAFWVSGASMLSRFALAERIAYHPPLVQALGLRAGVDGSDVMDTVDAVAAVMAPGGLGPSSRLAVLDHVAANAVSNTGRLSAAAQLVLCSPEFIRY